jgi:hypothetical protein
VALSDVESEDEPALRRLQENENNALLFPKEVIERCSRKSSRQQEAEMVSESGKKIQNFLVF